MATICPVGLGGDRVTVDPIQDERRRRWLAALDACLVVLADQRLLDEAAGSLLDNVLLAFDTPHAYLDVGSQDGPIGAVEGRGCWVDDIDGVDVANVVGGPVVVAPVH